MMKTKNFYFYLIPIFLLLVLVAFLDLVPYQLGDNIVYNLPDNTNEYSKIELKPGLNLIALDLGGPVNTNRANGAFGDAAILEQNNNYLLIDTGTDDDNNTLINFLKSQNINHFNIYISHFHSDHFGKVKDILSDNSFVVDNVYFPDIEIIRSKLDISKEWYNLINPYVASAEKYVKSIKNLGKNVVMIGRGSTIHIGDATLKVLWDLRDSTINPNEMYHENSSTFKNRFMNDTSLVSMITYKDVKFLNCGDIEKYAEEEILKENIDIKADIFKFSHHGGTGSNTDEFLYKVNPTYAYFPNNYIAGNNVILWYGDRDNGIFKSLVDNLVSKTNVLSTLYNGNIIYNISLNGEISSNITRNYHTLTIKYLDILTDKEISEPIHYVFNDKAPYHLEKLKYIKMISNYTFSKTTYQTNDILTSDKTIFNYYKKDEPIISQNDNNFNNSYQDNQAKHDNKEYVNIDVEDNQIIKHDDDNNNQNIQNEIIKDDKENDNNIVLENDEINDDELITFESSNSIKNDINIEIIIVILVITSIIILTFTSIIIYNKRKN